MKLPAISGKDIVKALQKEGFVVVSQKGSHVKLRKDLIPTGTKTVIVPMHKTVKPGTLRSILKQSYIELDHFLELL